MPCKKLSPTLKAFEDLARSGPDPRVVDCFDLQRGELRLEAFERYLAVASHGEQIFAKFLATVFLCRDRFGLDISDAAAALDHAARVRIAEWVVAPIWP